MCLLLQGNRSDYQKPILWPKFAWQAGIGGEEGLEVTGRD